MADFKTNITAKHLQHSFIEITKINKWVKEGQAYNLIDFGSEHYYGRAILVENRIIRREDITPQFSHLDKQCNVEIYNEILDVKGHDKDQLYSVLTFSKTSKVC